MKTQNFSTCITTIDGNRYYMTTYHFYLKLENTQFAELYDANPIKHLLTGQSDLLAELNPEAKNKVEKKLEKQYEIITRFNFNDYVYIPYSACLISKYPYTPQMEKMLEQIIKMCVEDQYKVEDIYNMISHCIREIPVPPNNKQTMFYIPYSNRLIDLIGPINNNIPIINTGLTTLMYLFSVENLITIHYLMLLEQRILFVGDDYNQLTEVIDSFVNLLYPME
jgi:hypothetical protein